jgi:L-ascorbate 6-phosphate lactonase
MQTGKELIALLNRIPIIPSSLAILGLGQMGVAIKGPEAIVYIDPCLSDVLREQFGDWWNRAYPPPIHPADITNADYYLISHEHQDHLDPNTVCMVAKASPGAMFIAPKWCLNILGDLDIASKRVLTPNVLETIPLSGTSMRLTPVPSAHYQQESNEQNGNRWLGYIIEWNGVTFYHSGDTIIYPGYIELLKQLPKSDIAMVPVNGRDWFRESDAGVIGNLLPVEAARLARDLEWDMLIPAHNDLYPNNTIPMAEVVEALTRIAPQQKYKILQPGELYYYIK